jgi:hypothetical protein
MPIIRDISLNLKTGEVLRRQGFRDFTKIKPGMKALILELLAGIKEAHLLEPAIAYEIYSITEPDLWRLSLKELVPGAEKVGIAACSIGPALEKRVTEYFKRDEPLLGVLLDGIGSAAVYSLTEEVCKIMTDEAVSRGCQASSPINPGMPGLPVTEQRQLFKLVPAHEIGISLTSAGVMVPRKSVSMVIGLGPKMEKNTRAEVCARCRLCKTCAYRIPEESKKARWTENDSVHY